MELKHFTRILFPILILTFVCSAFAQDDLRTKLQSNYDKVSRLSIRKDKVRLEKVIRTNAATNFEYIDAFKNSMDVGATVRQNTEQLERVATFNSNSNKIIGVKVNGHDIVCTVKTEYDIFLDSERTQRVKGVSISEDTWIKTLTGWKIKRSKVVKESAFQNGKPLP